MINKAVLLSVTFFLGGFGVHIIKYGDCAYQGGFKSELQNFITAEELYFLENNTECPSLR